MMQKKFAICSTALALLEASAVSDSTASGSGAPADEGVRQPGVARPVILTPEELLKRNGFTPDPWLIANIPFFECPDRDIEEIYYYRWWSYRKNIHRDEKTNLWTVHEGGGYGITPCPLGHHLYEGRWLKNRAYIDEFCRYWLTRANPRRYSNWFADACHARWLVDGDTAFALSLLPGLKKNHAGWRKERFDATNGLYRWIPDRDGMEASLAGFEDGEVSGFTREAVLFGGEGARPSFNSYMFADALALAAFCELAGDQDGAAAYRKEAEALKAKVQQELWDPARRFFIQRRGKDWAFVSGRELIGFYPWAFGLPDDKPEYAEAWRQLRDPQGFEAKYGPTTLERRNPYFMRPFNHACLWNGPSWPYSTSVTLAALANLLNDYRQDILSREDYVALLATYARTQRDPDGRPMVRENHHPDEKRWLALANHKGVDGNYNHSRYADLVITGLAGIRPAAGDTLVVNPLVPAAWDWFCLDGVLYHGRPLTIFYDRTGERYGKGKGLRVLVDGREVAASEQICKVTVPERPG